MMLIDLSFWIQVNPFIPLQSLNSEVNRVLINPRPMSDRNSFASSEKPRYKFGLQGRIEELVKTNIRRSQNPSMLDELVLF